VRNSAAKFAASVAIRSLLGLLAVASHGAPAAPLSQWLAAQEQQSWQHMLENVSPTMPKQAGEAPPVAGIVVAALQTKDPDYYFHWVRDSALIMRATAEAFRLHRPFTNRALFEQQFSDFLTLSRRLQQIPSQFGLGEPRYTVAGEVDQLPWSRPQYDGPALRAIAALSYLKAAAERGLDNTKLNALARAVLQTDLDFILTVWNQRGFDVWEELKADSYHTRLVQLAALEQGADWMEHYGQSPERVIRYRSVARMLEPLLDDHWDPTRGFLRSQLAIVATDGYTAKKTDLDSQVIVAVVDADREGAEHTVLDDRVQATVAVLEDLYRANYPINRRQDVGLGYGRYAGDVYFGGNPWVFITADFATFYYRLALRLQQGASLEVSERNTTFLRALLPDAGAAELRRGLKLTTSSPLHRELIAALEGKADRILDCLRLSTPADGQMYEQFDKQSGQPASSRGIGWSHAAFLMAVFERQQLNARVEVGGE
jgi:glucoamylase